MTKRKSKYCIYQCRKEDCSAVFTSLPARKRHENDFHPGENLSLIKVPIEAFNNKEERDQRISVLRKGYVKPVEINKQVDEETSGVEETSGIEEEIVLKEMVVPSITTKVEQIESKPKSKSKPEQVRIYKRKSITEEFFDWLDSDD